jgi:hypothetical protein
MLPPDRDAQRYGATLCGRGVQGEEEEEEEEGDEEEEARRADLEQDDAIGLHLGCFGQLLVKVDLCDVNGRGWVSRWRWWVVV